MSDTTDVVISDGNDWQITYYECCTWIDNNYPSYRRATIGDELEDWDWTSDFGHRHIMFSFKDPDVALLFKLTFGGQR